MGYQMECFLYDLLLGIIRYQVYLYISMKRVFVNMILRTLLLMIKYIAPTVCLDLSRCSFLSRVLAIDVDVPQRAFPFLRLCQDS